MRIVGRRLESAIEPQASGELLVRFGRFNDGLSRLGTLGVMPKGVYRYRTQTEADAHAAEGLAQAMAALAARRLADG